MSMNNEELVEFYGQVQAWYDGIREQLSLIILHPDADLHIGDKVLKADSKAANGVRCGIAVALDMIGEPPFSLKCVGDDDLDQKSVDLGRVSVYKYTLKEAGDEE